MTTTLTAEDLAFIDAMLEDPFDPLPKLAMADRCLERDDSAAAECWRWMAEKRRCSSDDRSNNDVIDTHKFWWFKERDRGMVTRNKARLPDVLISKMKDDIDKRVLVMKGYRTISKAFTAIIAGWRKLTPGERRLCWQWEPPTNE